MTSTMACSLVVIAEDETARHRAAALLESHLDGDAAATLRARGAMRHRSEHVTARRLENALSEIRGVRVSCWPLRDGVAEVDGSVRWLAAPPPRGPAPAGTPRIDAYHEGLALLLELPRPARAEHVEIARLAHQTWCETYESESAQAFRNTDVEASIGQHTIRLWADRIRDPDGSEAARASLAWFGAELARLIPGLRWRIASADEDGGDAELAARLGAPVIAVRPGGDLVAQVRAAGLLPPGSPRWAPLAGLLVLTSRVAAIVALDSRVVASVVAGVGVIALTAATRAWCGTRELALAGLVASVNAVRIAALVGGGGQSRPWLLAEAAALLLWYLAWSKQMRATR